MSFVVCFDALGTLFSPEPLVEALDEVLGDRLRAAGSGARSTIMDWVSLGHQRVFEIADNVIT